MSFETILVVVGSVVCIAAVAIPVFVLGMRRAQRDHEAARRKLEEDLARPRAVGPAPRIVEGHTSDGRSKAPPH